MDLVGALYSSIEERSEDHHHHQSLVGDSGQNDEYFFFSDDQSDLSDNEQQIVSHQEIIDESNLEIGEETMVVMEDEDEEDRGEELAIETAVDEEPYERIERVGGGNKDYGDININTDFEHNDYKPVLDEREREKLYKMAVYEGDIEDDPMSSPRGAKFYSCDQCDESFGRKVMLEKHIEKFHKDDTRPYTCTICLKKFKKRSKLQKHSWTHIGQLADKKRPSKSPSKKRSDKTSSSSKSTRNEGATSNSNTTSKSKGKAGFVKKGRHSKFNCDMCKEGFSNPTKLLIHKRTVHRRITQCDLCNENFQNKKELDAHRKKFHPGERIFACSYCSKKFFYESVLLRHEATHTAEAPFRCEPCQRGFLHKIHLSKHLEHHFESQCKICGKFTFTKKDKKSHDQEHRKTIIGDMYDCRVCEESFTKLADLTTHCRQKHRSIMQIHQSKKKAAVSKSDEPIMCRVCHEVFEKNSQYRKHFASVHKEPVFCRYCPRSFATKQMVENHERVHTGEKPFECKLCEEKFRSVELLKVHLKTHKKSSGRANLTCSVCSAKFEKSEHLVCHKRTHYNEKPFQCDHCGLRFSQVSQLKTHKNFMHTVNRAYDCKICSRKFTKSQALTEHRVVHTGIPFMCLACNQEFLDQSRLTKHERRIHAGEKVFQCLVCFELFDHRSSLFRHELLHNGESPVYCKIGGLQVEDNIAVLDYNTECFIARRREQMLSLHMG